jgi:hypothetical protein
VSSLIPRERDRRCLAIILSHPWRPQIGRTSGGCLATVEVGVKPKLERKLPPKAALPPSHRNGPHDNKQASQRLPGANSIFWLGFIRAIPLAGGESLEASAESGQLYLVFSQASAQRIGKFEPENSFVTRTVTEKKWIHAKHNDLT